eukprot:9433840-Ditylum_brightwellii.AAC.1
MRDLKGRLDTSLNHMPLLVDKDKMLVLWPVSYTYGQLKRKECRNQLLDAAKGLYTADNVIFTSAFHDLPSSMRQRTC